MTAALLAELVRSGVKVIFCDEKCNPSSELLPYYGAHNTSKRIKVQTLWSERLKGEVWKVIITQKINNQRTLLEKRGFFTEAKMLEDYASTVEIGDATNREGHAAKVYFNAVLPDGVTRRGGGFINACLNYGYAVLLSAINREIVASGYVTQLGIWHDNEFNQFNLGSDLMYKHCEMQKVALFLVEGTIVKDRLPMERKIIITDDLCEIVANIEEL